MKKLCLLLIIAIMFAFTACNKDNNVDKQKNNESRTTTSENFNNTKEPQTELETEPETLLSRDKSTYNYDITYEMLANNPDEYLNKPVKFVGRVEQIQENNSDGMIYGRMSVNNDTDLNLFIAYEPDIIDFKLNTKDEIIIYAGSIGLYSYQTLFGGELTIPAVIPVMIDLCKNSNELCNVINRNLTLPTLPLSLSCIDWDGNIESTVFIEKIDIDWNKSSDGTYSATILLTGQKTYGDTYTYIGYELYDSEGYLVDSDSISIGNMTNGTKFKNIEQTLYGFEEGIYTLKLTDFN